MMKRAYVTFLGTRGTIPVEGSALSRYGGATSCVLLRMGDQCLILDAGTGFVDIQRYLAPEENTLHLLLSHPHFDHMMGLPPCQLLYDPGYSLTLYAQEREGRSPRQQLECLMSPPLWPVEPDSFQAKVSYVTIEDSFCIGDVKVRLMEGAHPGGSTVFRVEWQSHSLVYASDIELDEQSFASLAAFAEGCSLLLCDGQYAPEEFEPHRGFGHSTWRAAAELAAACKAKALRILHHAPWRTDAQLDAATPHVKQIWENSSFARIGEEIIL